MYGEYKFLLCSHFWGPEGNLDEQDNSEVSSESRKKPEKVKKRRIPETFFYSYEDVYSGPYATDDTEIPTDLLTLKYPFCWACANSKLMIFYICSQDCVGQIWSSLCDISGTPLIGTHVKSWPVMVLGEFNLKCCLDLINISYWA